MVPDMGKRTLWFPASSPTSRFAYTISNLKVIISSLPLASKKQQLGSTGQVEDEIYFSALSFGSGFLHGLGKGCLNKILTA